MIISVIIPAFNEAESIGLVLNDIPKHLVRDMLVVNNASTDNTRGVAENHGAVVLNENIKGYGSACLKGMEYLRGLAIPPDVVVFMDGDYSDHPEELPLFIEKINEGFDFVIGSRAKGQRESGSMMPQQRIGNWLAVFLIRLFYRHTYSDLGPFRAICYPALMKINMKDPNFGWTVEMQIKALQHHLRICEVPVSYRRRVGISKVSGTLKGTIMAGYKIIYTIFKYI